eukprot:gene33818-43700_t
MGSCVGTAMGPVWWTTGATTSTTLRRDRTPASVTSPSRETT